MTTHREGGRYVMGFREDGGDSVQRNGRQYGYGIRKVKVHREGGRYRMGFRYYGGNSVHRNGRQYGAGRRKVKGNNQRYMEVVE